MSFSKIFRAVMQVALTCCTILMLLIVANQALGLAMAGVYNNQTERYLSFWKKKQKEDGERFVVNERNFQVALKGADKGIEQLPDSAEQWILKARVLSWGRESWGRENRAVEESSDKVLISTWQTAAQLRPSWPYIWSDYAMARARQSFIDTEFEQALLQANRLGPWEAQVMETSAILGSHYRGWLSPGVQTELDNSLVRLTHLYPGRAGAIKR